jgi:hypothetical protein
MLALVDTVSEIQSSVLVCFSTARSVFVLLTSSHQIVWLTGNGVPVFRSKVDVGNGGGAQNKIVVLSGRGIEGDRCDG